MKKPAGTHLRFWLWLLLATWPPALIAAWGGWDLVDPRYLALLALWWPIDLLARLSALALGVPGLTRAPRHALGTALAAEALLSLKLAAVALLGLLPAIAFFSYGQVRGAWLAGLLGALPSLLFTLRRSLSPLWAMKGPLNASETLLASVRQTDGRSWLFLRLAGPWMALGLGLELAALGLPELAGLALGPLSLAAGLQALKSADQGLA